MLSDIVSARWLWSEASGYLVAGQDLASEETTASKARRSCFDDPRVTVATSGALEWFAATFGEDACSASNDGMLFDAIIMDLLGELPPLPPCRSPSVGTWRRSSALTPRPPSFRRLRRRLGRHE